MPRTRSPCTTRPTRGNTAMKVGRKNSWNRWRGFTPVYNNKCIPRVELGRFDLIVRRRASVKATVEPRRGLWPLSQALAA